MPELTATISDKIETIKNKESALSLINSKPYEYCTQFKDVLDWHLSQKLGKDMRILLTEMKQTIIDKPAIFVKDRKDMFEAMVDMVDVEDSIEDDNQIEVN